MKRGKEIKVNIANNYTVNFGTVDNKNAKSVYINISTWGDPKSKDDLNYSRVIRDIDKKVRQTIYDNIQTKYFNKDKTIIDLDMRKSGIKYGKRSFMNCEITLSQNHSEPVNNPLVKDRLTEITMLLINDIFEGTEYFDFYKMKKEIAV
jgi:hypothetical protein